MKIYVHKTDLRSWQYYPEIPDDRKSGFYEVITDLTNDELISDYEFVLQNGVCTPVRKNKQAQPIADATKKKADAMVEATLRIAPLQDAVDLDMATEAEKATLLAWKKYRVLLNRVDITQAPDVEWPEVPDAEKTGG